LREADGAIYTSTEPVETESEDTDHAQHDAKHRVSGHRPARLLACTGIGTDHLDAAGELYLYTKTDGMIRAVAGAAAK